MESVSGGNESKETIEEGESGWLDGESETWEEDPERDGIPTGFQPPANKRARKSSEVGRTCLYDELFSGNAEAISECFDAVRSFIGRHMVTLLPCEDRRHMNVVSERGPPWLKLAFIVTAIVHERALREQIEDDAIDEEAIRRIEAFHRVASIATRSLFESPFTEKNAVIVVKRFLYVCFLAWNVMSDRVSVENYADFFGARQRSRRIQPHPPSGGIGIEDPLDVRFLPKPGELSAISEAIHGARRQAVSDSAVVVSTPSASPIANNVFLSFGGKRRGK